MIKVCNKWSLEDFCSMEEKDMESLVQSFEPNVVPSFNEVRLKEEYGDPNIVWEFDGSFGWAI